MTKSLNLWLINIVLSAFFMSCTEKSDTGIDLQSDASILNASLIDTFTVNISTVLEKEDIPSSGSSVLLSGAYTDEYLGKVWSNASFQLVPSEENTLGTNPICDSVILTLSYLQDVINEGNDEEQTVYHYYGDIYSSLNLEVYQLEDAFEPVEDKIYYTVDEIAIKVNLEGETGSIVHDPESDNALTISLDKESFGAAVLANYSNDHATFLTNVKGLQLIPSEGDNGAVIGFDANSENSFATVYYHNDEGDSQSIRLVISEAARRFNHIEADHSTSPINYLNDEGATISSEATSNKMYLQTSTGVRILIEVPYLNDFLNDFSKNNVGVLINKVELILPVDPNTAINGFADSPPVDIALHQATDGNLLVRDANGALSYITNEGDEIGVNKDNNYYPFDDENMQYRMNLGLYVQRYSIDPTEDFRIIASAFGEGISVNRGILFDTENSTGKTLLKFYYSKNGQ